MQDKKKKVYLLILGCLFIILCLGGVLFFLNKKEFVSPKTIFTTALKRVYEKGKTELEDINQGKFGGVITLKTDLKSDQEDLQKVLEIINALDLQIDSKMNTNEEKMQMDLTSSFKEKALLDLNMQIQNTQAYLSLGSLFDKTLSVPVTNNDLFTIDKKVKDYSVVLEKVMTAFEKSLKDEYFSQAEETRTIANKEETVKKSILTITEENLKEILQVLSTELNNEEFISAFANLSNLDKNEIKTDLEKMATTEEFTLENPITIQLYTYKLQNEFAGLEIQADQAKISLFKTDDSTYSYALEDEEIDYTGSIFYQEQGDLLKVSITLNDIENISGTIHFTFQKAKDIVFDTIDTQSAISIESLSESDQYTILENIQKQEGILELIQAFQNFNSLTF